MRGRARRERGRVTQGVLDGDSGALVVGAAYTPAREHGPVKLARSWSNHGVRVHCFAWGDSLPRHRPGGRIAETVEASSWRDAALP